jgi:type VI protein secretion system component VasF
MQAQLSDAREQIQRLKDRLADQGLRQRKTGAEAGGNAPPATMQQQHSQTASGVPLQIVAGLCLLSFLIAYFFF